MVSVCKSLLDICFVVDASGSICDTDPNFDYTRDETCNNWNLMLQFMHRIADELNIGLTEFRFGMVLFDTTARVGWNLTACVNFKDWFLLPETNNSRIIIKRIFN